MSRSPRYPRKKDADEQRDQNESVPQTPQTSHAPALFDSVRLAHGTTVDNLMNNGDWVAAEWVDPISGPRETQKPIVGAIVEFAAKRLPDHGAKNRHCEKRSNELCESLG